MRDGMTGRAIWPTATPTAGSIWPGAPLTGCGWTARTWPRPIERILQRLPEINHVAVYAVPDDRVGDQVMAAIVLNDGVMLSPNRSEEFLAAQRQICRRRRGRGMCESNSTLQDGDQQDLQTRLIQEGVSAAERCAVGACGAERSTL